MITDKKIHHFDKPNEYSEAHKSYTTARNGA